jgi:hypothetical protein
VDTKRLTVAASAAIEAATGIALILTPGLVARLLIGAQLSSGGLAVGRVCGIGLLSLGLATWPRDRVETASATVALFVYNLLTSVYLGYLGGSGDFTGLLLWPACVAHALLMILLAGPTYRVLSSRRSDEHS